MQTSTITFHPWKKTVEQEEEEEDDEEGEDNFYLALVTLTVTNTDILRGPR